MKFGMCGGLDRAGLAAAAGYDYMEGSVDGVLKPRESEEVFQGILAQWKASPLPVKVLNCFIPGDLKICTPDSPLMALYDYARTAIRRAAEAGIEQIVFGSGGARQVPEGYSREKAWQQLLAFSRFCAQEAQNAGVVIALEPLNSKECNIITGVREGAKLVREVDNPHFRLLVDSYHWGIEGETATDIEACGSVLSHAHVATYPARVAPGMEDCGLENFLHALKSCGYDARVSVEAAIGNTEKEFCGALAYLRGIEAGIRLALRKLA